jgi:hypothetical protein
VAAEEEEAKEGEGAMRFPRRIRSRRHLVVAASAP